MMSELDDYDHDFFEPITFDDKHRKCREKYDQQKKLIANMQSKLEEQSKIILLQGDNLTKLEDENATLRELLTEVLGCPASFEDSRVGYAERQVPVALFDEIRKVVSDE
jgi:hypothetical protein